MIDPQLHEDDGPLTTDRLLRQFAALWLVIFGGMAAYQWTVRHDDGRALALAVVALAVGPIGLIRPQAIRVVFKAAMAIAAPIGWVVSNVILGVIFYALFTPVAALLRAFGSDSLQRRRRANVETYWKVKPEPSDLRSYLRQL